MIYAGLIHFNEDADITTLLIRVLQSFTETAPSIHSKCSLFLCYGKLSQEQDLDDIWENDSSVLIGRIFDKEKHCSFRKKDFKALANLNKNQVLEKIWGKYVFFNDKKKENSEFEIVLDSTGQLPFFYYVFSNGNILFSSDIEVIYKVLSQKPEYNWSYLCSYLIYGNSSSIQTPFKNIHELPPACSLTITKGTVKTAPFWNPLSEYEERNNVEKDVVSVLKKTLKPWITPYQNIIVSLSGGLDSSSLVYCLKDVVRKDQTLKAINYFHSQIQSSNEFHYAQKVCEEANVELIGIDVSNSLPFDPPQKSRRLKPNKPFPGFVSLRWMETIFEHLPDVESSTFISGHGSDHIFMRPPSKKSTVDYLIEKGFRGYKGQLKSIAQFYRDPLFVIFKENLKVLSSYFFGMEKEKRNINEKLKNIPSWVKQDLIQTTSKAFSHPIYEHLPIKLLPGKYDQVDALYEGLASIHMETMNSVDPTYYPFLYEPAVQFALSFSTYELFDKGYDRYPLRKAINDRFKTDTVWRRDKSQTTGLIQLGVKKNLDSVLETCLEGLFGKEGLIEKEGLCKTINLIGNGDTKYIWSFMHLVSAEMFLRYWDERN